jgi:hypothetical protein
MLIMLMVVVGYGVKTMDPKKAKKMFIQNSCFTGVLMVIVVGLIKLKNTKNKKNKSSSSLSILEK